MGCCTSGGACYVHNPGTKENAKVYCQCGLVNFTLREAGPRFQVACACINCAQREDWCIAQGLTLESERPTWHYGSVVGNAIVEFNGIEHCKAWTLSEKSPLTFVVCTKCHTNVFENIPLYSPNSFGVPTGGGIKWECTEPVNDTSLRACCFNCDLDPKYDPNRKNVGGTYMGKGKPMEKMDPMTLIGFIRTLKLAAPKQKGDLVIETILSKILNQQGGKVCIINGGKGIGPMDHPDFKEPEMGQVVNLLAE